VQIFGLEIAWRGRATGGVRTTSSAALSPIGGRRGWIPIVREPFTGAWQQNQEIAVSDVLAYGPVFACVTLIAQTIAKLGFRLMRQDGGIWTETANPAFSPVMRKPNRYQTWIKFVEQWITQKLIWGNAYVLKERDARGVVVALYVLNAQRVEPLTAPDGAVYYALDVDLLAEIPLSRVVPAAEIIHDPMVCLYHPLCGVSPIYACGVSAMQGLAIAQNSTAFFTNGSQPPGVITVPGSITQEDADAVQAAWSARKAGHIAILQSGMKYDPLAMNAVDAELIKQLQWTGEDIARCFHVPGFMIEIGSTPPYGNYAPLVQMFYADALQPLMENFQASYEDGVGLTTPINGTQYGVEFDVDDLLWMDHETRAKVAGEAIQRGALSPNEARRDYFGKGPVAGGETPYLQEQNWPLQLLAERPAPGRPPTPPAALPPVEHPPPVTKELDPASLRAHLEAALGLAA
jgi:HK97 family phage portal protein